MKKITIIEFESQYTSLLAQYPDWSNLDIYCANPNLWSFLDDKGVQYYKVKDDFIKEDWKKIVIWTREISLTWFDERPFNDLLNVKNVNIGNVILSDFRHVLLQIATNVCIVRKILNQTDPEDEVIVFKEAVPEKRSFWEKPEQADTINYILDFIAKERNLKTTHVKYQNLFKHKLNFKKTFRVLLSSAYSLFSGFIRLPHKTIVSIGGANHLSLFWEEFKKRNTAFVFLDSEFRPSTRRTAKKIDMPYLVHGPASKLFYIFDYIGMVFRFSLRFNVLIKEILESKKFIFDGFNLSNYIAEHFQGSRNGLRWRIDAILYTQNLIQKLSSTAILLDEDTSFKRVYSAAFASLSKPSFVTSHGITGADYRISSQIKTATYGNYFVNSEFEKEKYCTMGWDPEKLKILGVSRFDSIFHLKQKEKPYFRKKIILYCPHRLTEKRTRAFGISTPGYVTYQNTQHLIDATRNLDCELWIKPHADAGDIPIWKSFEKKEPHVRVFSPNDNVFELLHKCDLLVTTFSSVIIEGLLFELPIISINFTGDPDLHPYAEFGVLLGAYKPSELSRIINSALNDTGVQKMLEESRRKHFNYFCGYCDGMNTKRSVDYVLKMTETKITAQVATNFISIKEATA